MLDVVRLYRIREILWWILTPGHTAILKRYIVGIADKKTRRSGLLKIALRRCWAVVENTTRIGRPAVNRYCDVVEHHVAYAARRAATNAHTILRFRCHVADAHAMQLADPAPRRT